MKKILNKIISKIKGEEYKIDDDIPNSYLISLSSNKLTQLIRGFFTKIFFAKKGKGKKVFIGKKVKIICKKKIACGKGLSIGDYTYINALSREGIKFGNNCSLGRNCTIECTGVIRNLGEELIVGNGVGIAHNCLISVRGKVNIGDDCIFGPGVKVISENHNFSDRNIPIRLQGENRKGISIGKNCWIGANAVILDGVTIGEGSIIAAGAVVSKDCEPFSIYGGVPAKKIKDR